MALPFPAVGTSEPHGGRTALDWQANDRNRQFAKNSATFLLELAYSLEQGRTRIPVRAHSSRCKISDNWRATADEDGHYCFAVALDSRQASPQSLKTFAGHARKRMRTKGGGYRRDHLRALAQRVEVDAKEVRIMDSKSVLLREESAVRQYRSPPDCYRRVHRPS
jgi:hypothetical protein